MAPWLCSARDTALALLSYLSQTRTLTRAQGRETRFHGGLSDEPGQVKRLCGADGVAEGSPASAPALTQASTQAKLDEGGELGPPLGHQASSPTGAAGGLCSHNPSTGAETRKFPRLSLQGRWGRPVWQLPSSSLGTVNCYTFLI